MTSMLRPSAEQATRQSVRCRSPARFAWAYFSAEASAAARAVELVETLGAGAGVLAQLLCCRQGAGIGCGLQLPLRDVRASRSPW